MELISNEVDGNPRSDSYSFLSLDAHLLLSPPLLFSWYWKWLSQELCQIINIVVHDIRFGFCSSHGILDIIWWTPGKSFSPLSINNDWSSNITSLLFRPNSYPHLHLYLTCRYLLEEWCFLFEELLIGRKGENVSAEWRKIIMQVERLRVGLEDDEKQRRKN